MAIIGGGGDDAFASYFSTTRGRHAGVGRRTAAAMTADGRRRGERSPAVKAIHTRGQVASLKFDMDFGILRANVHLKRK